MLARALWILALTPLVDAFRQRGGLNCSEYRSNNAKLSEARAGAAGVGLGNTAVFAGGVVLEGDSVVYSAKVDVFTNPDSFAEVYNVDLTQARANLTATAVGTSVIITGGINMQGQGDTAIHIYNTVNNSQHSFTHSLFPDPDSSPKYRYGMAAVKTTNSPIAVFAGGWRADTDGEGYERSNDVLRFNLSSNDWLSTQSMKSAKDSVAIAEVGGYTYIAGGKGADGSGDNSIERIQSTADSTVEAFSSIVKTVGYYGLAAIGTPTPQGDILIFAGGYVVNDATTTTSAVVMILSNLTGTPTSSLSLLSYPRARLEAVVIRDLVIFGPGVSFDKNGEEVVVGIVDVLNTTSMEWSAFPLNNGNFTRRGSALVAMAPDKFLIAGGLSEGYTSGKVDVVGCFGSNIPFNPCDIGNNFCRGSLRESYCEYWRHPSTCWGSNDACQCTTPAPSPPTNPPTPTPTVPTIKPTVPTQKPTQPTEKPTHPTPKPTLPTAKPTTPVVPTDKPTKPPTKPQPHPTPPPVPAPTSPTHKPTDPTMKPTNPPHNPPSHPPTLSPTKASTQMEQILTIALPAGGGCLVMCFLVWMCCCKPKKNLDPYDDEIPVHTKQSEASITYSRMRDHNMPGGRREAWERSQRNKQSTTSEDVLSSLLGDTSIRHPWSDIGGSQDMTGQRQRNSSGNGQNIHTSNDSGGTITTAEWRSVRGSDEISGVSTNDRPRAQWKSVRNMPSMDERGSFQNDPYPGYAESTTSRLSDLSGAGTVTPRNGSREAPQEVPREETQVSRNRDQDDPYKPTRFLT